MPISIKELFMLIMGLTLFLALYILKTQPDILKQNKLTDLSNKPLVFKPEGHTSATQEATALSKEIVDIMVPTWQMAANQTNLTEVTVDDYLIFAKQATESSQLLRPEKQNTLYYLNLIRQAEPNHPQLIEQLKQLEDAIIHLAGLAIANNDTKELEFIISRFKNINPTHPLIQEYTDILNSHVTINRLLDAADSHIQDNNLYSQNKKDAWHHIKQAQNINPQHTRLLTVQKELMTALAAQSIRAAQELDFTMAQKNVALIEELEAPVETVQQLNNTIETAKQSRFSWLDEQFHTAIDNLQIERAEQMIADLKRLDTENIQLSEYQSLLNEKKTYGNHPPFSQFQDTLQNLNGKAPTMVSMPVGEFVMGRKTGKKSEQPAHKVLIEYGFAISLNEITVKQFKQFIEATNYQTSAHKKRIGKVYDKTTGRIKNKTGINWSKNYAGKKANSNLPVIHVSWEDAKAYVDWLSKETGISYRLPSEAEFEYVLASGNQFKYPWGNQQPNDIIGNFTGQGDRLRDSRARWREGFENYKDGFWGPAPVGSFIPNLFSVNDMSGNVMEWVQDCWHDSYVRAPGNGQAWYNPGCENHVIRGGSWSSALFEYETQHRYKGNKNYTDPRLGFRIARDLIINKN